ncbi:MAG: hypothetical protein KDK09_15525 [Rhodobacteraceae bacterium]|nr:hypothetical protein [Paracoccaceae bacterium]
MTPVYPRPAGSAFEPLSESLTALAAVAAITPAPPKAPKSSARRPMPRLVVMSVSESDFLFLDLSDMDLVSMV